jgi:hypothetical protein
VAEELPGAPLHHGPPAAPQTYDPGARMVHDSTLPSGHRMTVHTVSDSMLPPDQRGPGGQPSFEVHVHGRDGSVVHSELRSFPSAGHAASQTSALLEQNPQLRRKLSGSL